jgi:hypothetical protein
VGNGATTLTWRRRFLAVRGDRAANRPSSTVSQQNSNNGAAKPYFNHIGLKFCHGHHFGDGKASF